MSLCNMDEVTYSRCRNYLDRLAMEIDQHLPGSAMRAAMGQPPMIEIPLERLPTVAALVREYVECEALLASVERPSAE